MTQRYLVLARIAAAKAFLALFLATVPLVVAATLTTAPALQPGDHAPSPGLDPSTVVRIQVEALRNNSLLNEGIVLTYRFASPGNKRFTGPLDRFIEMVRSAPYDQLLNHRSANYGPVVVTEDKAQQIVIVTDKKGDETAYHWMLSRQSEGEFRDCWMTDAVIPAKQPPRREFVQEPVPQRHALEPRGWPGVGCDALCFSYAITDTA